MADFRLFVQMKGPAVDGGDVRLDDFIEFLRDLQTVLNATDRAVAFSEEPTVYYKISDLTHSSPATIELGARKRHADIDVRSKVLSTFVGGVADILHGRHPVGFGASLLLEYRDLGKNLNGRIREAAFTHGNTEARVSHTFREKIESIVGPDRSEHGEVSGMLDAIYAHRGRSYFWLYPPGAERIRCFFKQEQVSKVGSGLRQHVTVSGLLRFKASMLRPYAVNVTDIDVHEQDDSLPSLTNLRGIAPNATGGVMSEDFVRRLRDAW